MIDRKILNVATGLVRYRRMITDKMTKVQAAVAARYGKMVYRRILEMDGEKQGLVFEIADLARR